MYRRNNMLLALNTYYKIISIVPNIRCVEISSYKVLRLLNFKLQNLINYFNFVIYYIEAAIAQWQ